MKARVVIGSVLALELLALGYFVLMAWLLSGWFLDDAQVDHMQPMDWWIIAGQRVAMYAGVAVLLAGVVFVLNRWLFRRLSLTESRLPRLMAPLFFLLPFIASLIGAIQFGVTKPYM